MAASTSTSNGTCPYKKAHQDKYIVGGGALDRAQMDYGPVHCKYLECLFEMRGKQTIIESVGLHFQSIEVRVCAYDARLFICLPRELRGREKQNKQRRGKSSCVFSYESDGDKTMQEMAVRRRSKYKIVTEC